MSKNDLSFTKKADFLLNYSRKNKTKDQVIKEMDLQDYEQIYLDEAMRHNEVKGDYTGMALDRYILQKLDEEQADNFDKDEVIYVNRDHCR
ncbi:hypothetical protein JCM19037_2269 [Geomicrobium sp. JCM 19037]|uniref:hypothetical protein n=1 Tax=Geomicrobium sp. JCM 19037 TaxID=1460634 RepID=UPI00045F2C0B|nr:hypothetical protein [Geomicrobium sp. JCM 19037]GAK03908.1 hypothetical protein JCM19037_2269 [Geomicrobium sp. JCM 19037]